MRYRIGAEQLQQVPSLVHRPGTCSEWRGPRRLANPRRLRRYRGRRLWDKADQLQVLDQDWEAACFVEKCPGCFAVAITQREAEADKR